MAFVPFTTIQRLKQTRLVFKVLLSCATEERRFSVGYLIHGPPIITCAQEEKLLISGF